MKENDDYIYRCDLAERLKLNVATISRAANRAKLKERYKNRRGTSERYFLIGEVLKIKAKLRKPPELKEPPKRANNIYNSWQRIMF